MAGRNARSAPGQPPSRAARQAEGDEAGRAAVGTLRGLLEVEERIEAEVAAAQAEAARRVAAAQRDADAMAQSGGEPVDERLRPLREAVQRDCQAAVHAIEERAEADLERYRRLDDVTLGELARWVAARLVEAAASTP